MAVECGCPEHYPDWDGRDVDLSGCPVHDQPIPMFLHMPIAYDLYAARQQQAVERMELPELWPGLRLTRTGMFRGSVIRLLGAGAPSLARFIRILPFPFAVRGKLHAGNLSTGHKVIREMQMQMVDMGRRPRELYICYLTCPACFAERGERILFLRRWTESAILKGRSAERENGLITPESSHSISVAGLD